jgi:hypothetical protein
MADHLKSGQIGDFEWSTSLDRFIKKIVMNKIFLIPKWSRLVIKISGPDFEWQKQNGGQAFEIRTQFVSER